MSFSFCSCCFSAIPDPDAYLIPPTEAPGAANFAAVAASFLGVIFVGMVIIDIPAFVVAVQQIKALVQR